MMSERDLMIYCSGSLVGSPNTKDLLESLMPVDMYNQNYKAEEFSEMIIGIYKEYISLHKKIPNINTIVDEVEDYNYNIFSDLALLEILNEIDVKEFNEDQLDEIKDARIEELMEVYSPWTGYQYRDFSMTDAIYDVLKLNNLEVIIHISDLEYIVDMDTTAVHLYNYSSFVNSRFEVASFNNQQLLLPSLIEDNACKIGDEIVIYEKERLAGAREETLKLC